MPEQTKPDREQPAPQSPLNGGSGLVYLVIGLVLLVGLVFLNTWLPTPTPQSPVPYSQFLEAVEAEQVTEVEFAADEIRWMARDDGDAVQYRSHRISGVDDTALINRLREAGVTITGDPPSPGWNLWWIWLLPLVFLVILWWRFLTSGGTGQQAQSFGRSRARLWEIGTTSVTFDNVAGVDEAVMELREVVDFLNHPEKYTEIGAHIPKGVILVGPPGTGKTLLARATAGEAGVPFFSISGADFVEMFVGVGAARARDLFRQAREKAPCIVFIDELDALGRRRASARAPITNEEREQTLNQLLVEIDGFDSSVGVIIMAATNRPDLLDPALLRPGRFDRQVVVDKPDLNGREAILQVHAKNVKLHPDADLRVVAARTPGFAGAELANVINEAALLAVRQERKEITIEDLDEAVDRVMAGLERKSRALIPKEREIVAHHEMGHALMGMLLPYADPVHKVSIVPRGAAALGATIQAPLEDRYLLTQRELNDRMTVLLGGRAAEEVVFGEISTGGADDLQRAAGLARRMVTQFGMTRALGPVALEELTDGMPDNALSLSRPTYSEATAQRIDAEVKRVVDESYQRARSLLSKHTDTLLALSSALLKKEVMDGEELAQQLEAAGIQRLPRPGVPKSPASPLPPSTVNSASIRPEKVADAAPDPA